MPTRVTETAHPTSFAEALTPGGSGRFLVQLIDAGWGASGHYSAEVLQQAAQDRVFAAGTQMFTDHPTATEDYERPARSVKDLAAVLTEDARFDPAARALVAEVRVYGPWRAALSEMATDIGVSIRAVAEGDAGQVDGRSGFVVSRLVEGLSVDFVTRAGRGGRVLEVLESHRAADRAIARGVEEATANELREFLVTALRAAYASSSEDNRRWVWLADFDATRVWFEVEPSGGTPTLYEQSYTLADGAVTLTGSPVNVRIETRYVPVIPAGQSTTTTLESKEDTMPQIEEARLRQLEADAGRVSTLESERDAALTRATEAETRATAFEAATRNRPIIAAVLAGSATIPPTVAATLAEAVLAGLPVDADETTVRTAAEAARTARETEYAQVLEAAGTGSVRGLGTTTGTATQVTESDVNQAVARAFGRTTKEA